MNNKLECVVVAICFSACCGSFAMFVEDNAYALTNGMRRVHLELRVNGGNSNYYNYTNVSEVECGNILSRIAKIPSLEEVSLSFSFFKQTRPVSFESFAALTNLIELRICGRPSHPLVIDTLSPLSRLRLERLWLYDVVLPEGDGLSTLQKVRRLDTNSIRALEGVVDSLHELTVWSVPFDRMCDLSRFTSLKSLIIANIDVPVTGLQSMRDLETLTVICPLSFEYPLSIEDDLITSAKLRSLELEGGRSGGYNIDFQTVAKMHLRRLSLSGFPIRKVSCLTNSTIEELLLMRCPINDLSNICYMPNLKFLDVSFTGIDDVDAGCVKTQFPRLEWLEYIDKDGGSAVKEWSPDGRVL